jgi:hypothetical protein
MASNGNGVDVELASLLPDAKFTTYEGPTAVQEFVDASCPSVIQTSVVVDSGVGDLVAELHLNGDLIWNSDLFPPDDVSTAADAGRREAECRWPGITKDLHEDLTKDGARRGRHAPEYALINLEASQRPELDGE